MAYGATIRRRLCGAENVADTVMIGLPATTPCSGQVRLKRSRRKSSERPRPDPMQAFRRFSKGSSEPIHTVPRPRWNRGHLASVHMNTREVGSVRFEERVI